MIRVPMQSVACILASVLVALHARAGEPPQKLTAEERKDLEAKWKERNDAGDKAYEASNYPKAVPLYEEGLKIARRLYAPTEFPNGHPNFAESLNNLAFAYQELGRLGDAEPLYVECLAMRRRLSMGRDDPDLTLSINNLAILYKDQGKLAAAEPLCKEAMEMRKRLYQGQDNPELAVSMNNLGFVYKDRGKLAAAELLFRDALEMRKRLFKGQDNPALAISLDNLAGLYYAQGKLGEAEPLFRDALEMRKRLTEGRDHLDIALSLNNLSSLYQTQGKLGDAELLCKDALQMCRRLFEGRDHSALATNLDNLATLYLRLDKLSDSEPLLKEALQIRQRLYKGRAHPNLVRSLNNLASLYWCRGELAAAETLFKEALEMQLRLFQGQDHADLARSLQNLAVAYKGQGRFDAAEATYKRALEMFHRLAVSFAQDKSEGETLTLLAQQPLTRDGYLSTARMADPSGVYAQVWADKGFVARAYERRLLLARAAAADPGAAPALADLIDARRRRAELLLAPATKDPGTLAQRKQEIAGYEGRIEKKTRELKDLLPASVRANELDAAVPADLQKALPNDAAVVDFLRFVHFEYDKNKPGKSGETRTPRYLAFVVTKEKVAWVDLDAAKKIEPTAIAWRDCILGEPSQNIPPGTAEQAAELGRKVRELVWAKVRKELPAAIKTVYVCPDAALCRVPFAALPGDEPGTILLKDFAVATIPHAPFLLDKLRPQDPIKNHPSNALVVGGVKYDAELAAPNPAPNAAAKSGEPLLEPGRKSGWGFLPNTVGEANGVAAAAVRKKLTVARFDGDQATTEALLKALPRAKYAHFATHGFFADASFRSAFQLDDKDYEKMASGERRGAAALSPLVMTGLVFAGANREKTPGRGIITGEQLIDLDLSGLELAVLSACETGLGDVAGGQGTFGLQRAFHYAGTTNVVCSLWKVPDESTAALMNLFYANLWDGNQSPMEALRQAQLEVYRNPGKIADWSKGFRGQFKLVKGAGGEAEIKPTKAGKAHPLYWAAFTLSGPGR